MLLHISFLILLGSVLQVKSSVIERNDSIQEAPKEVCMKELGCFAITSDFISLRNRPINVLPHDRVTINTKLQLYTKKHPKEAHQLVASNKKSIDSSQFNAKNPTVFIVHGFMDSELYGTWMQDMKDEFLLSGDSNVIIVDWSGGNKPPYYQATANTRVVGAEIALMIETLEKQKGAKRGDCHIIGHSLGSHIAGYAGLRLKTLGRITGLDPAEPYFKNMPKTVRLDLTDAQFVDVIHSDATDSSFIGLGMIDTVGHVDFYPNGGRNQPGCKKDRFTSFITNGLTEGMRRFVACNHQRAVDFFHHSINHKKVTPVAYECKTWDEFLDGKCTECGTDSKKCAIMGLRAIEYKNLKSNTFQRAMFLQTSGKAPFFLFHYQITLKLFKPRTAPKDVKGTIDITLFGTDADELFHVQSSSFFFGRGTDLYHGSQYQYVVTTDKDLGEIKSVSLKWYSSSYNPLNLIKKPAIYVEYVRVIPMNQIEKSPRSLANRVFCDKKDKSIPPKTNANLYKKQSC